MCAEQDNQESEGAKQHEDVIGSYELLQQQLMQANETIATLMEQMSQIQQHTSQCTIISYVVSQ